MNNHNQDRHLNQQQNELAGDKNRLTRQLVVVGDMTPIVSRYLNYRQFRKDTIERFQKMEQHNVVTEDRK